MLLCFDFDGVLVDSLSQQLSAVRLAQGRLQAGRTPVAADFAQVEDLSYEGFARHIGVPAARLAEWKSVIIEILLADQTKVSFFPEMREILLELSSRFPSVIITSNVREAVERLLHEQHCTHAVQEIYDGKSRGTKGEKLKAAARTFGIPLSQTYLIGDTRSDVRHAKAAGARAVAVSWGYQPLPQLEQEQPDALIRVPRDLLTYFGTLDVH